MNFIKTALVAVFCCAVGYTAYNTQNKNENLSDVMLTNVEALAGGETGGKYDCGNTCGGSKCGTFTDNDGKFFTVYYC